MRTNLLLSVLTVTLIGCSAASEPESGTASTTQAVVSSCPNPIKPEKVYYKQVVTKAKALAEALRAEAAARSDPLSTVLPKMTYVNDRIVELLNEPGALTYNGRGAGDVLEDKFRLDDFSYDPSGWGEFPGVYDSMP